MPASQDHVTADTPMGANLIANGATFRVWAPNASGISVRGSFNNFKIRDDATLVSNGNGHWFGFIPNVKEWDTYKFWVTGPAGSDWKRDPYARELDGKNWDCVIRSQSFPWHETGFATPQFHNFVIYQLHVGAFYTPRWPQHAGTFLDVIYKIPYLKDLGITAIQLMPIQEFPGDFGLGYNGTDYFSPEMSYEVDDTELLPYMACLNELLTNKGLAEYQLKDLHGETNQLKALIDICHVYGIAVIFDLVYNHAGGNFGTETLWFFDLQNGATANPPWFWNSLYFSDRTWAGGDVFNFTSDGVRQFLINNARFFLDEYRVDGFRYDEVSVIDHEGLGRGWDFCQALTSTLRTHRPNALQHAEYWNVNPWIVKETSDGGAGFHTTMTDGPRIALRKVLESASYPGDHELPMTALANQLGLDYLRDRWRGVQSLENHDLVMQPKDSNDHNRMERIPRVADPSNPHSWHARSRSRVATGILLTAPGIPMLFMGQEFLEDKQWSDDVQNHPELLIYWNGLRDADPTMRDFLRFTRELIQLRWQLPALRGEGFRMTHVHDQNRVLAFHRWIPGEGNDIMIVCSLSNFNQYNYRLGFPGYGNWREVFNSDVYDNWVNPQVTGNGSGIFADNSPLHDFAHSAPITLPANSLLVFAR
jgi:1,4-alpha-glucan branching enzyme